MISVVMAAHNAENTIESAIASIVAQTRSDWTLVVVDDASTDGTSARVEQHLGDPRITLMVNSVNLGPGRSRNQAIRACNGSLIAIMDADDIALPDRLARQAERFEHDANLSVLGGQLLEFGEWGGPVSSAWPTTSQEIRRLLTLGKMPIAHCAMMARKEAVLQVGGYDESIRRAEDFALLIKLRSAKIESLSTPVLLYRTVRPVPLAYVIQSGRDGWRVRNDAFTGMPTPHTKVSWLIRADLRSLLSWGLRRWRERATPTA